jgi:branched-chain amino acid aminotransferase
MGKSSNVFWVDGSMVADGAVALRPDDHGLVGDGVFEAIKVIGTRPFALSRHLRRLQRSADALGLKPDLDLINDGITEVCAHGAARGRNHWLRITVTGGSAPMGTAGVGTTTTTIAALAPMKPWGPTCDVAIVPWTRNANAPSAGLKTISYADNVIGLRWAHDHGGDEAIFGNTSGNLCEGTGSNIFVAVDGILVTPPLSSGCLAGVTRELLLTHLEDVVEADLAVSDLAAAPEAFLTSTSRDVHPIATVDGVPLPEAPGPLTRHAIEVFAAIVAGSDDP